MVGSFDNLESLLDTQDCIVLCLEGVRLCGCGQQFSSLVSLGDHIALDHVKSEQRDDHTGNMQEYFRKHFKFPKSDNPAVTVVLPANLSCVCLSEHDIGATAANIKCHLCLSTCQVKPSCIKIKEYLASILCWWI